MFLTNRSFLSAKLASHFVGASVFGVAVFGAATLLPGVARAQEKSDAVPGTVISEGGKPFTETLADIIKRDAPYQKALREGKTPPNVVVIPNAIGEDFDKDGERAVKRVAPDSGAAQRTFPAPPFFGKMDGNGHFVPSVKPAKSVSGLREMSIGGQPGAPQTIVSATTINGLRLSTISGGLIPPDTPGAVGPAHAMIFVNGGVGIYSKAGGALVSQVSMNAFFTATIGGTTYPRNGSFDPRVVYDRRSGRWFATGMELGAVSQRDNDVILAVSRTSDPTGMWDKYIIPIGDPDVGSVGYFTDYSTLGVDGRGVYIAARIFPSSGAGYSKLATTPLTPLVAVAPSIGAVTQQTGITDMYSTPQPALNLDNTAGDRAWFVASDPFNYSDGVSSFRQSITYRTVTWSGTTPMFSAATGTLITPRFSVDFPEAPALGGSLINTGDHRLQMAIIRNNQLWTTRTIGTDSTGGSGAGTRVGGEWISANVANATPTLTQSGRVYDSATSDPRFYYYPSVAVTGQGHMALGFSGSKSTEYVSAYTSGRLATDTAGTTQSILQFKAGTGPYTIVSGGRNRWGDYSYTAVDPNDDQTLWTFQEYALPQASYVGGEWAIWGQQLKAPAPTAAAVAITNAGQGQQGQSNVAFQVVGTGFFDPGTSIPAFTNRLVATVSGIGVSNVRAYYLSATTVGIQCDIAAGAAVGTRNLTLTNPDGQTVTVANALKIVAVPAVPVQLAVTQSVARVVGTVQVTYTVTNPAGSGVTFTNTRINSASVTVGGIATATTSTTPITVGTGTLAPGASASVTVSYPGTVGIPGTAALATFAGTHSAGSFGRTTRIVLP